MSMVKSKALNYMDTFLMLMLITFFHINLVAHSSNTTTPNNNSGMIYDNYCSNHKYCGANGKCDFTALGCACLDGFTPKSPIEWNSMDYTKGCVRDKALNCSTIDDVFFTKYGVNQEPSGTYFLLNQSLVEEDCKERCLSNCSCVAYNIKNKGCKLWIGDLFDVRVFNKGGQDLYIKMAGSEQEPHEETQGHGKGKIMGVIFGSIVALFMVVIFCCCYVHKKRTKLKGNIHKQDDGDPELPLYELSMIVAATDNFSVNNKLGEGGFGPVYKGTLDKGRQIAVKRLSSNSGQGQDEFKNEVMLIAKLRHRNLVKLIGCCIQEEEKLLIYEYMSNRSLDHFIFDETRKHLLDWPKRFNIICGVARGLLYLHEDSRMRVIHRDLKAGNVLLNSEMEPKISDFGLARSFVGSDQTIENTRRVVGTYGYMAPEYAVNGQFSVKSDVFSFGILLLEILSGKKIREFCCSDDDVNLYGHAWNLWKQRRYLELMDECMKESWKLSQVQRCIHISLLCAQQHPQDRPNMSSVVLMLGTEIDLPQPKFANFIVGKQESSNGTSSSSSNNKLSITMLEAR